MLRLVIIAMLSVAAIPVSHADMNPYICELYTGAEANRPEAVKQILGLKPGSLVKVCTAQRLPSLHFLVMPVASTVSGVCHYSERRVFEAVDRSPPWTFEAPLDESYLADSVDLMLLSRGRCPLPEDFLYVRTTDVSDELFRDFVNFWERATSTEKSFEAAFTNVPAKRRQEEFYLRFEAAVKQHIRGRHHLKMETFGPYRDYFSRYETFVRAKGGLWLILADFIGGSFRVVDVHYVIE
jgi:hypothetical protein